MRCQFCAMAFSMDGHIIAQLAYDQPKHSLPHYASRSPHTHVRARNRPHLTCSKQRDPLVLRYCDTSVLAASGSKAALYPVNRCGDGSVSTLRFDRVHNSYLSTRLDGLRAIVCGTTVSALSTRRDGCAERIGLEVEGTAFAGALTCLLGVPALALRCKSFAGVVRPLAGREGIGAGVAGRRMKAGSCSSAELGIGRGGAKAVSDGTMC